MLKIYTEIKQGSDEWFELRKGKMTASNATAIGTCGKGLDTYVLKKVAEVLSSGKRDTYTNKDLDRGNELEPIARSIYELETGDDVYEVGFIEKDKYSGCSPDGLVREDGGIEIKCVDDIHYLKILLSDKIESGYNWQIQMSLFISGRKWWDLPIISTLYFIT